MRYYKFQYERLSNKAFADVENALLTRPDPNEINIHHADGSFMVVSVNSDTPAPKYVSMSKRKKGLKHKGRQVDERYQHEAACFLRDEIWKHNGGMYCEFLEVSDDDVMDYL